MNTSMNLTAIRTAMTTAERLGAKLSKAATDDHAKLRALVDQVRDHKRTLTQDTGTSVLAALEAGRDPLEDPDVIRAVVRRALADTEQGLTTALNHRTGVYIDDHAVSILAALSGPFDQAAAKITAAREHLGNIDLGETHIVAKLGPKAGAAWAEVQGAEATIAEIQRLWKMLATVSNAVPQIDKRYRSLLFAEIPGDTYLDEGLATAHVTPWMAARRGWPLSLATPDTYRQRIDVVRQEIAQRQAQRDDAFREGYRKMHGTGVAL